MDLTFVVVGPGSVGSVVKRSLEAVGFGILDTLGRGDDLARIPESTSAVAICTPDRSVAGVAEALSGTSLSWTDKLVFHVSGALTSEVLAPLAQCGAQTASFHPLSSYPPGQSDRDLNGTTIAIEGDSRAVTRLSDLARLLGAAPVVLSVDQKAAYHLAASMASNFLVTLTANVQSVLEASGLDPHLMHNLIADTFRNLDSLATSEALTGPIARGDVETVRIHLETLESIAPDIVPLFRALANATIDLAFETRRIDNRQRRLLRVVVGGHPPEEP